MIFIRESDVRDPALMAEYKNAPRAEGGPMPRPLVVYGDIEAVEGDPPSGAVVLEFDSVEDARAWYNTPEYKAAAAKRMQAADYRTIIVEGWTPPAG